MWMKTYNGHTIDFEKGIISKVDIVDIAHSLSLQNRFMGHTKRPYSVAYHSVIVSHYVPNGLGLWGLLHDATEAYIGDIIRPMRKKISGFRTIEKLFLKQIVERFGLKLPIPDEVIQVDNELLVAETKNPMIYGHSEVIPVGAENILPLDVDFNPNTSWKTDFNAFMGRYSVLVELN